MTMPATFSIHPETTIGPVALTVADVERSRRFYSDGLGLQPRVGAAEPPAGHAAAPLALTADGATPLFLLHGLPGALPKPARSSGLYHAAVLLPDRAALARTLQRLSRQGVTLQGAADHRVSEALYLADPDGNGLELYRDRARTTWSGDGAEVRMTTEPLDLQGLLAAAYPGPAAENLAPATRIGHVHLAMSDLGAAEEFYCGVLGFAVTARAGRVALFVSAGGYHHHIGLNIFAGAGVPPPPPGAAGLRYFTILLPDAAELERVRARLAPAGIAMQRTGDGFLVRDPASNGVLLTPRVPPRVQPSRRE